MIRHIIGARKEKVDKYFIEFYTKENHAEPAKDYIRTLDAKMKAKLLRIFDILEEHGPYVRFPYSEPLGDGIFEIRAKQGTDIVRVLYFFSSGRKIILTNGFTKKQQKTPRSEILLAKKYRKDYERRYTDE